MPNATKVAKSEIALASPAEIRELYESGRYDDNSWGLGAGYVHTAVVSVPSDVALDFFTFCQRNSSACPVLEVLERGERRVRELADADVATAVGCYRVFRDGECVDTPSSVESYWRDDLVSFLIGCTASFEAYLMASGVDLPDVRAGKVTPVYVTNRRAARAGRVDGPQVVSMRQIDPQLVSRVVQLTSRFPSFHGAPVHTGDPAVLGVTLSEPYAGNRPTLGQAKLPMFWACSVTPQLAALHSKLEFMITNYPGYMFITDRSIESAAAIA